jgi:hypothetical protein
LWECAEFASDRLLGSHIQLGWPDTMMDLALGVGGAVIGAILGAASRRVLERRKYGIVEEDAYHELCAYTLQRGDAAFIHQHVVDAFAAQRADG